MANVNYLFQLVSRNLPKNLCKHINIQLLHTQHTPTNHTLTQFQHGFYHSNIFQLLTHSYTQTRMKQRQRRALGALKRAIRNSKRRTQTELCNIVIEDLRGRTNNTVTAKLRSHRPSHNCWVGQLLPCFPPTRTCACRQRACQPTP